MARELILNLKKKKSTFGISKIDRKKLYGFKKRLFLDEKGKECSKANLEEETGIVFVSSDISSSYLDHKGNFVEKKELEAINDKGKKVKKEDSTLGKEVDLTSLSVENALNLNCTSLWFESPNRLIETLKLMIELNNESLISVLRELTKLNEEIISGSPSLVYDQITKKAKLKGETVLVISNNNQSHYTNEMILDLIKKDYSKFSTKELALYISNKTGLPKKSIYNRIIELKS